MSAPVIITKEAYLQLGKIIPRSWPKTRDAVAGTYRKTRKTPLGGEAARLIYDNAEAIPHMVLTQPIPLYPTNTITAPYSVIGAKNHAAKARTLKSILGRTGRAVGSLFDERSATITGKANMIAGW